MEIMDCKTESWQGLYNSSDIVCYGINSRLSIMGYIFTQVQVMIHHKYN